MKGMLVKPGNVKKKKNLVLYKEYFVFNKFYFQKQKTDIEKTYFIFYISNLLNYLYLKKKSLYFS